MLEKSLAQPQRLVPEIDPLSATVAAVAKRGGVVFRVAAPLALLITFGALLFVWANSGETAPATASQGAATASSLRQASQERAAVPSLASTDGNELLRARVNSESGSVRDSGAGSFAPLSLDHARKIVTSVSHGSIGDVQVMRTAAGVALVAIHDERKAGTSHFFVMEKRGAGFRISARGLLDTPEFRHAKWSAETLDTDGDGYDEVLFMGSDPRFQKPGYRLVLYVPRTRKTYWLRVEGSGGRGRPLRAIWSANALTSNATPYRTALRESVNAAIIKMRQP
jgi:hypothetical protein